MQKPSLETLQSSNLKMAYVFDSDPDPILASQPNATASLVSLRIMVSNRSSSEIAFDKIEIKIPVGEDSARCLSTDATLPQPINETPELCSISSTGSVVTITAAQGDILVMQGQSIIFNLKNITVNTTTGTVPITITEYLNAGEKQTGANTYSLVKEVYDYPVTSFYADPKFCYESGGTVKLYWTCSEYGQDCYFKAHSDSWHDETLYTAQDGINGIVSGEIYEDTNFALDIYKTDSDGYREWIGTLYTEVLVVVPKFYNTDYQANTGGNARLVTLYWTALNAHYCEIQVNDKTYISNAPTKTGPDGYLLFIAENDMNQTSIEARIVVIAHAEVGGATDKYYVQYPIEVPCSAQHTMSYATPVIESNGQGRSQNTYGIGITPDQTQAFVTGTQATKVKLPNDSDEVDAVVPWLNYITLSNFSCKAIKLNDDLLMMRTTNTVASNDFAYTSINSSSSRTIFNYIKKINLGNNKVDSVKSTGGQIGLSITADGQFLMLAQSTDSQALNPQPQGVSSFKTNPLSQLQQVSLNQNDVYQTAITPDGQKVLVINRGSNSVSILSLSNGTLSLLTTLTVGSAPTNTAITPDGQLALVTNSGDHTISIINMSTLTVEPMTIPAGGNNPFALAITSDGQYAYVVNYSSGNLTLIDIAQRCCAAGALAIGSTPISINIANQQLLMIQVNSNVLTSLPIN